MAKPNYDGVIEAVHYRPDGQVDWVRAFERRGPTWSDYVILKRDTLVQKLKAGKKFVAGRRIPQLAGTFEVFAPVRLAADGGQEVLVTGEQNARQDRLEGVPFL